MRKVWHNTSRRTIALVGFGLMCAAIGVSLKALQGETNAPVQSAAVAATDDAPLIVHEWGTFTSFSGSDGVQLEFRPNVDHELPGFVETRAHHEAALFLKSKIRAPVRMETPVTYFYTDKPRDVDVNVRFPHGLLTEFYPSVRTLGPAEFGAKPVQLTDSFLDWGRVHLIPRDQFPKTRVVKSDGKHEPARLPPVVGDDHYGFARQTDSAIVAATDQHGYVNFEKFLFYRGVGKFKLPLILEALGGGRFSVTNFGGDPIRALFLVHIEHGHVRFVRAAPLQANSVAYLEEPPVGETIDALAADMEWALSEQGLYEKEARAMVGTWRSSWFGEEGTRLLYFVPQPLTDRLLPLSIKPAPHEKIRVLVGRMEIMTREQERQLQAVIEGMGTCFEAGAEPIHSELQSLGRFAEPSLERIISQPHDDSFRAAAEALLAAARASEGGPQE